MEEKQRYYQYHHNYPQLVQSKRWGRKVLVPPQLPPYSYRVRGRGGK